VQYTDPFLQAMGKEVAKLTHGKRQITMQRGEFVDDATWYRSVAYCEYRRVSRVDDSLISIVKMTSGELHAAMLMRSDGESPFELRDRRMLHLFLSELSRLPDHELAPPGCEPISRLSKRLRHVLACLLEGDSEQQVANRLQLTRDTTHQYVKELYRLHNVHSRPELMAQFVRFPIQQLRAS
jgi:DNA-binding CsgD family transcriptional regulator